MSTFRIEKIDQGEPDEWIPRKNDDGAQIGDDVVAEDVNELSEGIQATQEILLKSNIYTPGSLLNPTEGIASRLKYLEETAGQASLQDVYENGNIISVLSGAPLLLGGNGAISLDDIGNLLFNPTTMRIKGLGAAYLGFSPDSINTYLSDLSIGTSSSGYNFSLSSGQELTLKDANLSSPIYLSEFGQSSLATSSQSIIGAINELKNSTFNTTLQSVYDQSSSGRILTNSSVGSFRVENGTGNPLLAAITCVGKLTVSDISELSSVKIGNETTINDTDGYVSTLQISTTNLIKAPRLQYNGTLTLQDNRIALTLSELGVVALETSSQSIAGAINELKASIDSVGGGVQLFGNEHSSTNGMHTIISTQAAIGQESTNRFKVKNASGVDKFTVNALGEVVAQRLNLAGVAIETAIDNLLNHMNGSGTDHTAVAAHLADPNPHNVVKTLNGLFGELTIASGPGITVGQSGSNIIISSTLTGIDLQEVYDSSSLGQIVLDTAGGKNLFFRNSVNDILMSLTDTETTINRTLKLNGTTPKVSSTSSLEIISENNLVLQSLNEGINISTSDPSKLVEIQGIAFSDNIANEIDNLLPQTVIGAINKIQNKAITTLTNTLSYTITQGMPVTFARIDKSTLQAQMIRPIADYHPMNGAAGFFSQSLSGNMHIALEDIAPGSSGRFAKMGIISAPIVPAGADVNDQWVGTRLYLSPQAFGEIAIQDVSLIADGDTFTLADKVFTANTSLSDHANGVFRVFTTGTATENIEQTVGEIIECINHQAYTDRTGTPLNIVGLFDGATARGKMIVTDNAQVTDGTVILLNVTDTRYNSVQFTGVISTAGMTATNFLIGDTEEETAQFLANAINRTTGKYSTTAIIQEDLFGYDTKKESYDLSSFSVGHGFVARAIGKTILIEREFPDFSGNLATFAIGTSGILGTNPSGGFIKVKYYSQDRTNNSIIATQSNPNGLIASSVTSIDAHGHDYLTEYDMAANKGLLFTRQQPRKIGDVIGANATTAQFFIDMD